MISLRQTATELDRLEEFHRIALSCYWQALRSTEQNAIEVDAAQAAQFRAQLQVLRSQLRAEAGPKELESVQTSFDTELRQYRDKTREQIQKLRQDVQAAAAAVESLASSLTESDVNLDSSLKRELSRLNQSAQSNNIEEMRDAIRASSAKIAASIEQMRSSNQMAIVQLKDEIRLLHQQVEARREQPADPSSESRQRIDSHVEGFIRKNAPFSVLLVVVRNLEGLQNCYSANVIASALRGFQARFENSVPSSAVVGRWANDQFAAVLSTAPRDALELSNDVVRKLSAPFLEQDKSGTHSVAFNTRAGVIEFAAGSDSNKFQSRLKQLAGVLAAER